MSKCARAPRDVLKELDETIRGWKKLAPEDCGIHLLEESWPEFHRVLLETVDSSDKLEAIKKILSGETSVKGNYVTGEGAEYYAEMLDMVEEVLDK